MELLKKNWDAYWAEKEKKMKAKMTKAEEKAERYKEDLDTYMAEESKKTMAK